MKRVRSPCVRILALDLHPQRYGYAVLESPSNLLDWGVRRRYCQRGRSAFSIRKPLRSLLEVWQPSLVAIKEPKRHRTARLYRLLGVLEEVRRYHIPTKRISEQAVQTVVGDERAMAKHMMASRLVERFPFLAFMLPPRRKIWESEQYRMSMFVAVAIALAASGRRLNQAAVRISQVDPGSG